MIEVPCAQCGRPGPDVIRLRRRTVRYSCRSCGAVISARRADVEAGRGLWRRDAAPRLAPVDGDPLLAFMPPRMVRWLREGDQKPAEAPDRRTLTRWYAEFDRFTAQARDSAEARKSFARLSEVPLDELPMKPTPFTKVIGALNASFYDADAAVAHLVAQGNDPGTAVERTRHAHRWFTTEGRPATWIDAEAPPEPDLVRVKALLEPGGLAEGLRGEQVGVFFAVLFGVAKGPSARSVVETFSVPRVEAAVRAYLENGARPLRDAVLAALEPDAGEEPADGAS
ncbi:hypothetical protein [Actinoallomurus sp. NPDC050550]|uniref:hypothetical protein n=1 Tax=Actinoallomurus sp. NPDC050550 TaxID=3154937 RepID=UPI0034044E54